MQDLKQLQESASQTAGPYVHIGCLPNFGGIDGVYPQDLGRKLITGEAKGQRITVKGTVYDGTGTALKDAMLEVWQADADGIYAGRDPRGPGDPHFTGFGRFAGDYDTGAWSFDTVKPGAVPHPSGTMMAPHISFWIVARGINIGLQTRMYFDDEDNSADPILTRIEHQTRVPTLIASKEAEGLYHFDIRLQGEGETIFFDV